MKPITINKSSLHYRLATKYGGLSKYNSEDFCTYFRHVVRGMLFTVIITCALSALLSSVAAFFIWMYINFFIAEVPITPLAETGAYVLATFGAIGATFACLHYQYKKPYVPKPEKQPSFFALSYRKLKDKTCFRVEYK